MSWRQACRWVQGRGGGQSGLSWRGVRVKDIASPPVHVTYARRCHTACCCSLGQMACPTLAATPVAAADCPPTSRTASSSDGPEGGRLGWAASR